MGGITTGVGIFSGIDSANLIEQLLAVDARPRVLAQRRIIQLQQQQAAFLDINSSLLALKTASGAFDALDIFDTKSAVSGDSDVLGVSAGATSIPGTYSFQVERLVSTQQMLSRGFVDADSAGVGASSFTFEIGGGSLTTDLSLSELNGGNGIERGTFTVTDSSGASATIDLDSAVTLGDALDAINGAGDVSVSAVVSGDKLVITDTAGGAGTMTITDDFGSSTASGLGIAGTATGTTITGTNVRTVSGNTALSLLNDGNGVNIRDGARFLDSGANTLSNDLVITARDGTIINVDLGEQQTQSIDPDTGLPLWEDPEATPPSIPTLEISRNRATTVQDVLDYINAAATAAGADLTAGINGSGTGLVITDNTGGGGNLTIESGTSGRTTAEDLGIVADVAAGSVTGLRVISGLNSVMTRNLGGGSGLGGADITVVNRTGSILSHSISQASLDGSLTDVIDELNTTFAGESITFGINSAGNGLSVTDASGGSSNLVISGTAAAGLGIETAGTAANTLDGTNAQQRWVSNATLLSDLNVGQGIGTGDIRITDASGGTSLINIDSDLRTVDDLLVFLNSRPIDITAAINANGDGIEITDTSGVAGTLKIEDVGGTVGKSLNIKGEVTHDGATGNTIDGSYEREVTFDATDTLDDVSRKINAEGIGVLATVINDGGTGAPFRLSFTSKFSGSIGRAVIDTKDVDLGLSTLSEGNDAVVFFGSGDASNAVLLTSSTNTLDSVVSGVTIDLKSASDERIDVTISRDNESIEEKINSFVEAYNTVLDTLERYDKFDAETEIRGPLFGDTTAQRVRNQMLRTVQTTAQGVDGDFQFLFQAGIRIGTGTRLEFDRDRFRTALEADATNVADLFGANKLEAEEPLEIFPGVTVANTEDTFTQLGVAEQIEQLMESFTNSVDGLLSRRDGTLKAGIELQEDRIVSINSGLDVKRIKLQRQFLAMEQTIAMLQTQSSSLNSIQFIG